MNSSFSVCACKRQACHSVPHLLGCSGCFLHLTDLCHTPSHTVTLPPFSLVHVLSQHAPSVCECVILMLSVCLSVSGMSDVPHLQPMTCVISKPRTGQGEGQREYEQAAGAKCVPFLQTQQHIHISKTNPLTAPCLQCV